MCLALGLVLRLSGLLGPVDRHENLSLAIPLALLMPLLVLAMPLSARIDLPVPPGEVSPCGRIIDTTIVVLGGWALGTLLFALRLARLSTRA